jgi:hypothetical protein
MLHTQSVEGSPFSFTGIACLELVSEEHHRNTQRTQGISWDRLHRHVHELLECGREPIICEKRKSTQSSTLDVVYHGETWLKLEETLGEVGR